MKNLHRVTQRTTERHREEQSRLIYSYAELCVSQDFLSVKKIDLHSVPKDLFAFTKDLY